MSSSDPFFIQLKTYREKQKITLDEISKRTKINVSFLESIENGDFNVLPKTYLRLFLKSYAIEIGKNPVKIIEEYEIYSYWKIKPKSEENLSEKKISGNNDFLINNSNFNFNRKKIISSTISLFAIYIFFTFVSNLNNTIQTTKFDKIDEATITSLDTTNNNSIKKLNITIPNFQEKFFNKSNLINIENIKLPISSPFVFNAKAKNNTRIHYRIEESKKTLIDQNLIMPKDTSITVTYNETIFIDLLNCNDLEFSINNIRLDNRINCNSSLLRASIDSTGAINTALYSK